MELPDVPARGSRAVGGADDGYLLYMSLDNFQLQQSLLTQADAMELPDVPATEAAELPAVPTAEVKVPSQQQPAAQMEERQLEEPIAA